MYDSLGSKKIGDNNNNNVDSSFGSNLAPFNMDSNLNEYVLGVSSPNFMVGAAAPNLNTVSSSNYVSALT